ncbi:MAG: protease family protein [Clostridiales bacterium]|nr:protease family protein [Clostridiales bacterium]
MKQIRHVNETFLVTAIVAVLASFLFSLIPMVKHSPLFRILLSQIMFVLPVGIFLLREAEPIKNLLRIHIIKKKTVGLLVLFAFMISPLLSFLNALSMLFTTNQVNGMMKELVSRYPFGVSFLVVAVVPAILEETVYRGVFYNAYRRQNIGMGIILSGLIFGLMHMNFNQFIYAFVMGMIFALLVEVTDSIFGSMVVHATINGSSVLLSYVMRDSVSTEMEQTALGGHAILYSIAFYGSIAIVTTGVAFWLLKIIAKSEEHTLEYRALFTGVGSIKIEKLSLLPFYAGTAICMIIMLYQQFFY